MNIVILTWIVLGLTAGYVASKIVSGSGHGTLADMLLGLVGSVVGGLLFQNFGMEGVGGLNLYSLLVAVVGAIVVLWFYHAMFSGPQ